MKKICKNSIYYIKLIFISVVLAVCLRVFVFASYKIPSYSMYPAMTAGDYILVSKWILGPRIFKNIQGGNVETLRLRGLRNIKRNDVLVFNFPYKNDIDQMVFNLNTYYIKRCVAIPGDTFYIENGIYKVKNCPDTLGYYQNQSDNLLRFHQENSGPVDESFPFDEAYGWTVLDFGPLYIPGKGDLLEIDTLNIKLYKNLIHYETGKAVSWRGGRVYAGEEILSSYRFQNNYYFMAGDAVFDSWDSRYWGLVPESHIVGVATLIWKSEEPETNTFRWDRWMKRIK